MKRKSLLLTLLMALFAPWAANAQTIVEIGDGTAGSNRVPIDTYYNYSISEQLYTADEIGTAGTITSISFNYINTVAKDFPIEVYMKNVDAADLSTAGISLADADLVFEGTLSVTDAGWYTIDLDTPFAYDGTSNLLIGVNKGYVYWFSNNSWQCTATEVTMARYSENDNNAYDTSTTPSTTSGNRPNIQMVITPSGGPVCEKPETFEVSNVTANSATLTWTGGSGNYNVEYKGGSVADWTAYLTNTTATTANLTGLTPGTAYQYRVQSVCGDQTSGWKSLSFSTPCAAFALPYAYGFEDVSDLECWIVSGSTSSSTGIASASDAPEGSKVFRFHYSEQNAYLISPVFDGTSAGLSVTFQYMNSSTTSSYTEQFQVGYTTNATETDPTAFTYSETINGQNEWVTYENVFPANTKRIAIKYIYTDGMYLRLDDFTFEVPSSCRKPTDLAVADITASTATLSWTENGEATAWQVEVTDLDGGQVTTWDATTNPYQIVGLFEDTPYSVRVNPVCDVEKWSDPITFRTPELCPRPTNVAVSDVMPMSANVSWTGTASSYNLRYKEIDASQYAIVTLNADDVWGDGTGYQMLLDADATAYGSIIPESGALASGDVSDAVFAEFEYKIPVNADGLTTTTNVLIGQSVSILIPAGTYDWCITNPTPGDAFWIASGNGSIGGRYDNYVFEAGKAYEFHVYMGGSNDATDLTIVDFNGTDESWSDPVVATSPYALDNLNSETGYEVQVQASCGEDGESSWVSAYFITPSNCAAPTALESTDVMPHSATLNWTGYQDSYTVRYRTAAHSEAAPGALFEDFESASLATNGWTVRREGEGTEYSDWRVFTPASFGDENVTAHSGDYVVMGRSWASEAYSVDNWLISPQVTLEGELSYWVLDDGTYHEHYDIYVSTTTTETSAFTLVYEPGDASSEWTQHTVDLSSYAGQQGYIAFRLVDEDKDYLLIDDITLGSVVEVPAGEWKEVEVSALPYTLENLEDETEYEWQVQGINASCDGGVTEWSEIATFTTLNACADITNLMLDDLTATSMTLSWTGVQDSYLVQYRTAEGVTPKYFYDPANEQGEWTTDNLEESSGWETLSGYFTFYYTSNPPQTLISPELTEIPSNSTLEFDYIAYSADYPETFKVGFSTTDNSVESFAWGDEVTATNVQFLTYTASVPDGAKYFAIQCTSDDQYALILDNFAIGGEYAEAGEWNYITVTEPTVTIDGLNALTTYDVYVQGICGEDEYTAQVGGQVTTPKQTNVTQTIALANGTNWFSTYLDITLEELQAALVAAASSPSKTITIKSPSVNSVYSRGRWNTPASFVWDVTSMYYIIVSEDCEIVLEGTPIDPAAHTITIAGGGVATWIGYPFSEEMSVTAAFAALPPTTNDKVKNSATTASYTRGRWNGDFNLAPGFGYIYISAPNASDRDFTYPSGSSKSAQRMGQKMSLIGFNSIDKSALKLNKDAKVSDEFVVKSIVVPNVKCKKNVKRNK